MPVAWKKTVRTSVYCAVEPDCGVCIGGSDWDRRHVPYTRCVAHDARGKIQDLVSSGDYDGVLHVVRCSTVRRYARIDDLRAGTKSPALDRRMARDPTRAAGCPGLTAR
jgi:hypothetical protein